MGGTGVQKARMPLKAKPIVDQRAKVGEPFEFKVPDA